MRFFLDRKAAIRKDNGPPEHPMKEAKEKPSENLIENKPSMLYFRFIKLVIFS